MSAVNAIPLLVSAGEDDYTISRSVRLRSGSTAYLTRTPAVSGSQTTWTWSAWFKRGTLSTVQGLFAAQAAVGANPLCRINFGAADALSLIETNSGGTTLYQLTPSMVFRDPSAWYHLVVVFDSTNATSTERMRMYVNGSRVTSFSVAIYPALNQVSAINSVMAHQIGRLASNDTTNLFNGYLTEINFIDGQALTPSSFGGFNSITGVWQPKKYTGTYGTNGFYLNFSDNSAATAAAIGKDYSGNGNNWTPNNISVTAGVTYDSMLDVPTLWADGGNGRGNYCILNPIDNSQGAGLISDGNLKVSYSAGTGRGMGSISVGSEKWYAEFTIGQVTSGLNDAVGICGLGSSTAILRGYSANGQYFNGSAWAAYGASYTTNDIIGIAVDVTNQTLEFFKNNVSQGQKTSIGVSFLVFTAWTQGASGNNISANFGQRPFTYTPPTGFKALNTQNLPASTIVKGSLNFDVSLWTGNGTTQSIVNSGPMQPDLVWVKKRNSATNGNNYVVDSVRGASVDLVTNITAAEFLSGGVNAFNSNGFTLGSDANGNNNGDTYVGWQWKAGGAAVTNTAGSITSQVSANVSAGFSVVTYTGSGANATVGHGLGVAPKMLIVKRRTAVGNWAVWQNGLTATEYLLLNSNAVKVTGATTYWNSTIPTSSVFSIGTATDVNTNTGTYVAYCFAEVAGYSAFGGYTGNGSGDGPFIYCGFAPRYIMIKSTTVAGANWAIFDTSRDPYNQADSYLIPNAVNAETVTANLTLDFLSNGFKLKGAQGTVNASAAGYVYAAFAENPFKYALAR